MNQSKKSMLKLGNLVLGIASIGASNFVQAAFWVNDLTLQPGYYGQGQAENFKTAIEGGEPLSAAEQKAINEALPETDMQRYYGRANINWGTLSLNNIKNRSTDPRIVSANVINKKKSTKELGLEFAFGKKWADWRLELECLINKNIDYKQDPVLDGSYSFKLDSAVKTTSLFVNVLYDFEGANFFKPYVGAGLGYSLSSANSDIISGTTLLGSKNNKVGGLGGQIMAGIKYRAFSRIDIDFGIRFGILGPVRWKVTNAGNNNFALLGLSSLATVRLGFIYLF
ncbi:MAG: hypothetical protein JWM09_555 [Francisellaceae bacterium]|nr:hypothetical protein [Francisellaceae bacterium]